MKTKRNKSLSLMLCMLLALSMFFSSSVVDASKSDVKDIKSTTLTVNGSSFYVTLLVNDYIDFGTCSGTNVKFDSATLSVSINYKNSKGTTFSKNFGNQTFKSTTVGTYKMPSSFDAIEQGYIIYKVVGTCKITKGGKSASTTITIQ